VTNSYETPFIGVRIINQGTERLADYCGLEFTRTERDATRHGKANEI
jgi:hypothetical protein